jgi:3-oxoadipate enol-lactonase
MAAAIPNARVVEIPGAGHLSNLENPDAFAAALKGFS